jgi:hypothetical protein
MKTLKWWLAFPRRLKVLKQYVEQFQPVGQMGVIQKMMDWKYNP